MAPISTRLHGVLDYAGGAGSLAAPRLLPDRRAAAILALSGVGTLTTSVMTDYELGVRRRVPMPVHLMIDAGTGALLLVAARLFRRGGAGIGAWGPLALIGVSEIAGAAMTERRPGDRPGPTGDAPDKRTTGPSGVGAGAAADAARTPVSPGVAVAPAPPEAPGPSVNPIGIEASDIERTEHADALIEDPGFAPDPDLLAAREASAAAAEAARIGGVVDPVVDDPAMDPVYEAGGGEQDGWEAAEAALIENATHGDGRAHPEQDGFTPELESDRSGVVYGEPDRLPSTEVVDDPEGQP
jgi:hypothetical protein